MTSTERSRLFRERHPGYYQRYHARRNAELDASLALRLATEAKAKAVLALPAPVEQIPIFDMIREMQKQSAAREAVVVRTVE